jgi:hypothetical protein
MKTYVSVADTTWLIVTDIYSEMGTKSIYEICVKYKLLDFKGSIYSYHCNLNISFTSREVTTPKFCTILFIFYVMFHSPFLFPSLRFVKNWQLKKILVT